MKDDASEKPSRSSPPGPGKEVPAITIGHLIECAREAAGLIRKTEDGYDDQSRSARAFVVEVVIAVARRYGNASADALCYELGFDYLASKQKDPAPLGVIDTGGGSIFKCPQCGAPQDPPQFCNTACHAAYILQQKSTVMDEATRAMHHGEDLPS